MNHTVLNIVQQDYDQIDVPHKPAMLNDIQKEDSKFLILLLSFLTANVN